MSLTILTLGLSPAIQKTIVFPDFEYGEVNRAQSYIIDAAGKSVNVARVLHQAGCRVQAMFPAGSENAGYFAQLCRRDGLEPAMVEYPGRIRTCITLVNRRDGEGTELVVNEPEGFPAEGEQEFFQAVLGRLDQGFDALIVSGSRPKGFSETLLPEIIHQARKRNIFVAADITGTDLSASCLDTDLRPDLIKINDRELAATFPDRGSLEQTIADLSVQYNTLVVISRGSRSTLAAQEGSVLEVPSRVVPAVNPIGCGDSMTAGITQGLLERQGLYPSIELGIRYAAANAVSLHPGWILETVESPQNNTTSTK
ncbi:1-phosphofructokinase family hexose kinase [Spirochaeta lutea]|uniref:Carbohydrate kinase PfkB domain-containing protein n=1 Tax=Spirochaeta lutea TaxID=1480694 RepID=A0A098QUA6_9SPIO|nr:PfkB family carbohydrate kinase [Spirochaeta lutea]KGE70973.1 hypothetical protein DC28_13640 [Spirochaeta lutea]